MAKKRDDEELPAEKAAEEPELAEEEAVEAAEEPVEAAEEPIEAAEDAEVAADVAEEDAADAEEVEDAAPPDDEEPYDDEPYEEEPPYKKPKVTGLTLTLCILNVVAALGFVYLLMLDYDKRQGYTFAAVSNEAALVGVGIREDRQGTTAALETMPQHKLSNQELAAAARSRGASPGSEPYTVVEGGLRFQLYADEWSPALLRELMSDLGETVGSLEEEMDRLKTKLPGDIKAVADQVVSIMAKATPADKQKRIAKFLYPLCVNPKQVEDVEELIYKKTQPADLDRLLAEAVERRILTDILLPIELFRASDPGATDAKANDVKKGGGPLFDKAILAYRSVLENAAQTPIDGLRQLLNKRLESAKSEKYDGDVHFGKEWDGQKRWTIEKRANAAFILVSVAYARKHINPAGKIEDELLYPKGLERASRLSGLYDFTAACLAYNDAVRKLHQRVLDAIALDRDGFDIQTRRSESFVEKHEALQTQIRAVQLQIRQAKARIADLDQQIKANTQLVMDRAALRDEVMKRTLQERAKTAKLAAELRVLQEQMHEANLKLADAAENNARLEQQLRRLSSAKGGVQ